MGSIAAMRFGRAFSADYATARQQQVWYNAMARSWLARGYTPDQALAAIEQLRMAYPERMAQVSMVGDLIADIYNRTGRRLSDVALIAQAGGERALADPFRLMRTVLAQQGLLGVAPGIYAPGSALARRFESAFLSQIGPLWSLWTETEAAARLLNEIFPSGYTAAQLREAAGSVARVGTASTAFALRVGAGRLGIGAQIGYGIGSAASRQLEAAIAGLVGGYTGAMTEAEAASFLASLLPNLQMLRPGQVQGAFARGGPVDVAATKLLSGQWSPYQAAFWGELVSGLSPRAYTLRLAMQQGILSQYMAGQAMPTGGLVDIFGRQAGYAELFAAEQAAGYANLAYRRVAEDVRRARFAREMRMMALEWGSGPFVPTSQVAQEISRRIADGTYTPDVRMGESAIGLAQQEAAIRRAMWRENLDYQRQSLGFSQRQLQLQREQLQLAKEEYRVRREYQIEEREAGRAMQLRQRAWQEEDWGIQRARMGIAASWSLEDINRSIRFSTGRERAQLLRQRERLLIQQAWEREDLARTIGRQREVWRYEDERYSRAVSHEQRLHELQMQRFALQERSMALQEEQLAAQIAHFERMAQYEEALRLIEDERFKAQVENMKAQMEEEQRLEKARAAAAEAEMALMALRLEKAEELRKAEEEYHRQLLKHFEEIIQLFANFFDRYAQSGQQVPGSVVDTPALEPPADPRQPQSVGDLWREALGQADQNVAQTQPVVVNFILDGEVIMSAVITPDRLRPMVQEIEVRERRR